MTVNAAAIIIEIKSANGAAQRIPSIPKNIGKIIISGLNPTIHNTPDKKSAEFVENSTLYRLFDPYIIATFLILSKAIRGFG